MPNLQAALAKENQAIVTMQGQASSQSFGSVLTSLQRDESVDELSQLSAIHELQNVLESGSLEELIERIHAQELFDELPEIIDGQLIFTNEEDISVLTAHSEWLASIVEVKQLQEEKVFTIDVEAFLQQLNDISERFTVDQLEEGARVPSMFIVLVQMIGLQDTEDVSKTGQTKAQQLLRGISEELAEQIAQSTQQTMRTKSEMAGASITKKDAIIPKEQSITASITSIQQLMGKWSPTTEKPETTSPLIKQFATMFKRANFGQVGGAQRLSIQLYPEHLGQVRVELTQQNGLLTARILASTAQGKDMLESHLHQLRQAFMQQNIQVERLDIAEMLTETPYDRQQHAFEEQSKEQHESEQQSHQEDQKSFDAYLSEVEELDA